MPGRRRSGAAGRPPLPAPGRVPGSGPKGAVGGAVGGVADGAVKGPEMPVRVFRNPFGALVWTCAEGSFRMDIERS
ncbi:hypothetical protein Sxan_70060 [Streptomyces xanthophaeus]|uniref:Uncharacterized protein n=1 Tax=Streptomyces xanthophaeus TaxID=67385 RepID=A0A919LIV2_9ACTN|nr:hypothetical protein Sxan_70060 [Streptomyces xanthophaeus]